ncbi:hemin ABC transporter substrate-binding protein [Neisseriaceae bacterium CLB008]|nr:ABC transporter substrate-binding protein [Neisseriaceae bacterium]
MIKKAGLLLSLCLITSVAFAQRVVVLTPDVADIVVAIGAQANVVGKDDQSKHHQSLAKAKSIGVYRTLSPEPILAQNPDLVVGSWMAQPTTIYNQLNKLGIKSVNVAADEAGSDFAPGIEKLGQLLGKPAQANALAQKWRQGMKQRPANKKRYILSYDGRMVAGKGTVGDLLIRLAGGVNAAANINGVKPLSREGWLQANPDVVIIADHNLSVVGGSLAAYKQQPELKSSPAVKNNKVQAWAAKDFLRLGLDSPKVVDQLHALGR